jgi:hypothetical protein
MCLFWFHTKDWRKLKWEMFSITSSKHYAFRSLSISALQKTRNSLVATYPNSTRTCQSSLLLKQGCLSPAFRWIIPASATDQCNVKNYSEWWMWRYATGKDHGFQRLRTATTFATLNSTRVFQKASQMFYLSVNPFGCYELRNRCV